MLYRTNTAQRVYRKTKFNFNSGVNDVPSPEGNCIMIVIIYLEVRGRANTIAYTVRPERDEGG